MATAPRRLAAIASLTSLLLLVSNVAVGGPAHAQGAASPGAPVVWVQPPALLVPTPVTLRETVSAPYWYLFDATTGTPLAGQRWVTQRPVASAVKVATALTVVRRSALDETVVITEASTRRPGASVGLRAGQVWTVEELLIAIIARSGNDAAEALALHVAGDRDVFMEMVRSDLADLGLSTAVVSDPSGLDDLNSFSAQQLAVLGAAALADPQLGPLLAKNDVELPGQSPAASRNLLLEDYPGATGIKTGYTSVAGNVLMASARRAGRDVVAVVMDADHDPARFDDARTLLDYAFSHTRVEPLTTVVDMRSGDQWLRWVVADAAITVDTSSHVDRVAKWPVYPSAASMAVEVSVDGDSFGVLAAHAVHVGDDQRPTRNLGGALADGIDAALRAASVHGHLR